MTAIIRFVSLSIVLFKREQLTGFRLTFQSAAARFERRPAARSAAALCAQYVTGGKRTLAHDYSTREGLTRVHS